MKILWAHDVSLFVLSFHESNINTEGWVWWEIHSWWKKTVDRTLLADRLNYFVYSYLAQVQLFACYHRQHACTHTHTYMCICTHIRACTRARSADSLYQSQIGLLLEAKWAQKDKGPSVDWLQQIAGSALFAHRASLPFGHHTSTDAALSKHKCVCVCVII